MLYTPGILLRGNIFPLSMCILDIMYIGDIQVFVKILINYRKILDYIQVVCCE